MIGPLLLTAGVLTVVPFALLTALVWFAWWPPHWLEPVLLLSLPAMCIPGLVRPAPPALRRHWWGGMILLTAAWYLASPHLTPVDGLSIGSVARIFAAEIELMFYGEVIWSPAFRLASFATAGVAAVAAVSMASWYAMVGLQWTGEQTKAAAPARPVNRLSDAAWAGRAEVLDRFSTPGGIVLGELTDPRRKFRFDSAVPKRWGRQGKGPLITLDPAAGNAHSLVFSGSGSFKTVGIAIPNALTFAGSLIVIDPKGEIHAATSAVRSARGRKPWLVTEEDGLDPIRLLTAARPNDGTVFDSVAEFLLPMAGDEKADSSTFFHQKAVRLLSALLGHLYYTKQEGTDLFMAANRILAFTPDALKARFDEAAEVHSEYPDREFIHVGLSEVRNTEPRQLSGVTATAANCLSWAGHASTRGFLASKLPDGASKPPDGDALLARVLDDYTDIYFRIPTPVLQANPGIARVLIGSLVRVLRDSAMETDKKAREDAKDPKAPKADAKAPDLRKEKSGPATGDDGEGGKDGVKPPEKKQRSRRLFLIDEARAMRRMDTLAAVRDEGRAYGIHLLQIFQSWQQVLECYGHHGAGAWANSVDAVVIGPVSDARQAQELSRMVGRHTVVTSSTSKQRNAQMFMPFSGTAGSSESTQLRELDLIQPAELRQLPPEAAIILAVGTAPIMASKAIWFTRADMTKMVEQAKSSSAPGKPPAEAPVSVAQDASGEVEATAAETDAEDNPASEPVKEQGISDAPVSREGVGDPPGMAAGQGRFQPEGDATGTGVDDGAAAEQPPGGVEEEAAEERPQAARGLGAQIHEIGFGDLGRVAGQLWLGLDEAGRDATVILASTDEIRAEINDTVREGLAPEEILHGRELELNRLISRGMTPARKTDIRNWAEGDAAVLRNDLWGGKARRGECFTVVAIEGDHAVLAHDDGRELKVKPGSKSPRLEVELYETVPISIRAGDHVRWTRDDLRRGLVSGQSAAILGVGPKAVRLATGEGRELQLARDDAQLRHLDHAYSFPVHGAQGFSADPVIAVIASSYGNLADQAALCMEACRDRSDFVVLTDNRQQLVEVLEAARECPGDGGPEAAQSVVLLDKEPIPPGARAFTTPRDSDGVHLANDCDGSEDDGGVAEEPDVIADESTIGRGGKVIGPQAADEPPRAAGDGAAEAIREEIPPPVGHADLRSLEVLEMAAAWYRDQLQGKQGAAVRAYLEGRGFDAEARGRRGFGYAPRTYGALSTTLKGQGVTVDELVAAGLVGRNEEDGSPYDRFRDRLMFPIEDEAGHCIAFGGRTMNSKAMATYLNSPQTRTFDKGRTVYNLGAAAERAAATGVLYVVEGYMDVASMVEGAGITNVVAPLGTAITSRQLELMWQKADRLIAALDGDEAGRRAAGKMVELALPLMQGDRELAFAALPEGEDPDSMIRAGEDGRLFMLLGEACPLVEELWRRAFVSVDAPIDSPERRAAADKQLKDALAQIPDPVVRGRYLDELTAMDIDSFGFSALGGQAQDKDVAEKTEPEGGDGVDDGAAAEQPPDGPDRDVDDVVTTPEMPVVSPDPMPSAPATPDVNKGAGEAPSPGAADDLPAHDHRETGVESDTAEASGIDTNKNKVEEDGGGEEGGEPETGRTLSSSAMDAVASGIVNHAVYSAIIQRSHPVQSHPFVDAVLNRADVTIPPGTVAKVILPSALGDGVEHADSWSLVFVPEDGCSPIQRIVINTDGTIIERCGPYRSGA